MTACSSPTDAWQQVHTCLAAICETCMSAMVMRSVPHSCVWMRLCGEVQFSLKILDACARHWLLLPSRQAPGLLPVQPANQASWHAWTDCCHQCNKMQAAAMFRQNVSGEETVMQACAGNNVQVENIHAPWATSSAGTQPCRLSWEFQTAAREQSYAFCMFLHGCQFGRRLGLRWRVVGCLNGRPHQDPRPRHYD